MDYIHELRKQIGSRKIILNCAGALILKIADRSDPQSFYFVVAFLLVQIFRFYPAEA